MGVKDQSKDLNQFSLSVRKGKNYKFHQCKSSSLKKNTQSIIFLFRKTKEQKLNVLQLKILQ